MPYISQGQREPFDIKGLEIYTLTDKIGGPGELNYVITRILTQFAANRGESYSTYNEIIGVLECVKQEFYRRAVVPFEEGKLKQNGDVY
ncbi:MAG: hypothetical protein CV089_02315 [Nitrospira sp. WS110]|nr:hypothetical protein [Nitrospira sp. WS110]